MGTLPSATSPVVGSSELNSSCTVLLLFGLFSLLRFGRLGVDLLGVVVFVGVGFAFDEAGLLGVDVFVGVGFALDEAGFLGMFVLIVNVGVANDDVYPNFLGGVECLSDVTSVGGGGLVGVVDVVAGCLGELDTCSVDV